MKNDAFSWGEFLAFHRVDGPYVAVYEFVVPAGQAELMKKDIGENGTVMGGFCGTRITEVLKSGGGVFSNLDTPIFIRRPANLGDQLYNILYSPIQEGGM